MAESQFTPLAPLGSGHDRAVFECGVPTLNLYLRNYALQNQEQGMLRHYVATQHDTKIIAAYYSLVCASLDRKLLPAKLIKGLGKYDIPIMLLARLAVDRREQGKKLGKALLKDAILRTMQAAEIVGLKLLLVHTKSESASGYYRKHGFEPVMNNPLKLFLPVRLSS